MSNNYETSYDFQQKLANEGKLGAYYTDPEHCESLKSFFCFGKQCLILEPSIGDAKAVKIVADKHMDDNRFIFGVELNVDTFQSIKDDPELEAVLNADFLRGIKASNNCFTFVFANPPYGEGVPNQYGKRRRLESSFVERIFQLVRKDGILCLIVPESVLYLEEFQRTLIGRFQMIHLFRFREKEYRKYKQCVVIGSAKKSIGWLPEEMESFQERIRSMTELPYRWEGAAVQVPESDLNSMQIFTYQQFQPQMFLDGLLNSPLRKVTRENIQQKKFGVDEKHPPITLKKNLLYLLAVSGEGQGIVGNEDEGTLHMQRGVAKRIETTKLEKNETDSEREIVTTSTQIVMSIVESDGTITRLKS